MQKHQETHARERVADGLVDGFINYLRAERDASPLTLRNYSAEIEAYRAWLEEKTKAALDWTKIVDRRGSRPAASQSMSISRV